MAESFNFQPVILALNEELASGGDARKTFDILVERGLSKKSAFETMLRAKVFCLNEIDFGLPDRWLAVVAFLAEGRAVDALMVRLVDPVKAAACPARIDMSRFGMARPSRAGRESRLKDIVAGGVVG